MAELGVKEKAAISRIAGRIAPYVTNTIVEKIAREFGVRRLDGSRPADKLNHFLTVLLSDARATRVSSNAIVSLAMAAHHRTVAGSATMTHDDAKAIVAEMRGLGLDPGDLAKGEWRKELKPGRESAPTPAASTPSPVALEHAHARQYVQEMTGRDFDARRTGLGHVIADVLVHEGLVRRTDVAQGDSHGVFEVVLDGADLRLECKWDAEPIGLPTVTAFSKRVRRGNKGGFGVLVSMTGFAKNINSSAASSLGRLNCAGLAASDLDAVLSGQTTLVDVLRAARAEARDRKSFLANPASLRRPPASTGEGPATHADAQAAAQRPTPSPPEGKIFIGHGRSAVWRDLKDFIQDRLKLPWEEFNREPTAGLSTKERLEEMLEASCFAFLVMTAEDEYADGSRHPRGNVIHEAGLFQGRLGFERAIILLEEGCEEFANIVGITQIRFPRGDISAKFEEIRRVLEREEILR